MVMAETPEGLASVNEEVARKQRLILAGGLGVFVLACGWWIFSDDSSADEIQSQEITVDMGGLVNRSLSQKEWISLSEQRLRQSEDRLRKLEGQRSTIETLKGELETVRQQNTSAREDAERVIAAYEAENQALRAQAAAAAKAPVAADPYRPIGSAGPAAAGSPLPQGMAGMPAAEVKVLTFSGAAKDTAGLKTSRPETAPLIVEDSPDYLPPNSYAPAVVVVGVDASTGVSSQSDPLPVVLRIIGPARSVVSDGRVLKTRIEGCLINGAARGDLSAEKVYVKLQRLTCDQPGGGTAVSEVKGFLAFGGKTGVRGQVVSREGALVGQAFLAGIAGGFGRGFSANSDAALSGVRISTGGKRDELSTGDIAKGGLGQGISTAGDMVAKYLIERAEQYQPVVEMPTGLEVEVVFLDGAFVRGEP
ncbi:MAG TPA: TraB/VirB10 family protein [Pedomonas sp.]